MLCRAALASGRYPCLKGLGVPAEASGQQAVTQPHSAEHAERLLGALRALHSLYEVRRTEL